MFASELHPTARALYLENWPQAHLEGDIRLVPAEEVPEHELLVGGFPCQCPGRNSLEPLLGWAMESVK